MLLFWLEAISFSALGVASAHAPAGELARSSLTEWACRIPVALFALGGLWSVYAVTSRFANRRAAIIATLACATMPSYFLIARQAMTDMPLVASMTAAIALLAAAVLDYGDRPLIKRDVGRFAIPIEPRALLLFAGFISTSVFELAVTLPARAGETTAFNAVVPFGALALFTLYRLLTLRSHAALAIAAAGCCAGLAVLAKGVVGLALPGAILLVYLALAGELRRLARLDLITGAACFLTIACPWYAAMLALHGRPFYDEMFGDNQWRRFGSGVHGDRSGDFTYYLRELGFGLFPWTLLAPPAFLHLALKNRRERFALFVAVWAIVAYLVVTLSATKFHHYILPAIPAIAIACGIFADELLEKKASGGWILIAGLPALALAAFDLLAAPDAAARFIWLFDYDYITGPRGLPWPEHLDYRATIAVFTAALAAGGVLLALTKSRTGAGIFVAGALAFSIFLGGRYLIELAPHWTNKNLIASYFRERRPQERLIAYRMFWRGESFYSENEMHDLGLPVEERTFYMREGDDAKMLAFLSRHANERVFVLTTRRDQKRLLRVLQLAEPKRSFAAIDEGHNKLILGVAEPGAR